MLTLDEIIASTSGCLVQKGLRGAIRHFGINSRVLKKRDVFIAIKGDQFDGHNFVRQAVDAGVCGVIVSREVSVPSHVFVVRVKDTVTALGLLANQVRTKFEIPFLVVTGSAGKTSTKEMIAAVLRRKYRVLKNDKNQNNHIGVPLTLFKLRSYHQVAVLEIGTNQPGDIDWLGKIIQPDAVVFTNIGDSHLEKLKDRDGVLREKSQILKHLATNGSVIFNSDDPLLRSFSKTGFRRFRQICFAIDNAADYRATALECVNGKRWVFRCGSRQVSVPGGARHDVLNALCSIACGRHFGIRYQDIISALVRPPKLSGRLQAKRYGSFTVIDDTYNANPQSFQGAIETLKVARAKRHVLVLSDMLELGAQARHLHQQLGLQLAEAKLDIVCGCGSMTRHALEALKNISGETQVMWVKTRTELHQYLSKILKVGDVILVKGSRGMRMDETVDFLQSLKLKE